MVKSRTSEHFDRLADRYSRLRASPDPLDPVTMAVAELGELRGCRVLDVGCGPGTILGQLVRAYGVEGVGIDPSSKMIEAARRETPETDQFHVARAEQLPFEDASFDAGLARWVVHHIDRPTAFGEVLRVLRPGGRLVITTTDPDAVHTHWMVPFFPRLVAIERGRFPSGEALSGELTNAGFEAVRVVPFVLERRLTRDEALEKLHGRAYSTFALMTDAEYAQGVASAEAGLPSEIAYDLRLLNVVAVRS
jgi:SAM-dependent methyltransferase